jgi:hypothetical protein
MCIGTVPKRFESQIRACVPPTLVWTIKRKVCPEISGALALPASTIAVPQVATHGEQSIFPPPVRQVAAGQGSGRHKPKVIASREYILIL